MNKSTTERIRLRLAKRHAAERRFRAYGLTAIAISLLFLAFLLFSVLRQGLPAFWQTHIHLEVELNASELDPKGGRDPQVLLQGDYQKVLREALLREFPNVTSRNDKRALYDLLSSGAGFELRKAVLDDPKLIGGRLSLWVTASDDVDMLHKGYFSRDVAETERPISDKQLAWLDTLEAKNALDARFNHTLFDAGDSREPELSGLWGATVGSFYTLLITVLVCFPLGVGAAIYLEEFAPHNRWTDLIEVNINNLAAVPSIVFGLLGLAVFINFFGLPRSVPLVGALVLALIILPTIIIAGRAAIKSVPPSIREAALGMGASKMQMVLHHVLPLAMPGMMTGTIIGMAHALGETAPLLMIGMVAFIVDIPGGPLSPSTALPVQIYLWADSPERAFVERTSAAIIVLLGFLVLMNAIAVLVRKRFERRW